MAFLGTACMLDTDLLTQADQTATHKSIPFCLAADGHPNCPHWVEALARIRCPGSRHTRRPAGPVTALCTLAVIQAEAEAAREGRGLARPKQAHVRAGPPR